MLDTIIKYYTDYMKNEKKLSLNSLDAYIRDAYLFKDYLDDNNIQSLNEVNKTNVITYLVYLQRKGKAASTISRNLASLRCLFQYLLNLNIIKEDPSFNLKSPKKENKSPTILTKDEVKSLLKLPDLKCARGSRDKAILELLYGTGLRVSEINSLNIDDLDLKLGIVKVREANNTRNINMGSMAQKYIIDYLNDYRTSLSSDEPLFLNYQGSRLTRQGMWKILKFYSQKADMEKSITPQVLRNSSAVHLVKKTNPRA